jgi:HEPN domain-containing protein
MGTLGGAAAAIGVGATGGWNPATMAMAYQAGSALGSGVNSIVKPYNQQEVRGMPYTQASGWETFNQVAPAVGSAYGAYQTAQQQQQQSDYNNQLNNLLKMHQIMDMNPAATTGMINQLNSDHTKKYELDGKQPYMFDMGATSGVSTDQFNYKQTMSNMSAAENDAITNGNLEWFEQNKDHEYFNRAGKDFETSLKYATQNNKANLAEAERKADTANRAAEKHDMAVTEYTQSQADRMIEPFAESIKSANNEEDLLRLSKNLDEEFSKNENWTQNQKALLSNQLSAKYHDVVVKPKQETYGKELEKMVKNINSQTSPTVKDEFIKIGKLAGLSNDEIEGIWVAGHNEAGAARDESFLTKIKNLDLWNVDIMGKEIRRDPEVVRQQISYIWRVTGASRGALDQAYDAVGVLKNAQVGGGGYGADVPDKATTTNMGNGAIMALPQEFDITAASKDSNPRLERNYIPNEIESRQSPKYKPDFNDSKPVTSQQNQQNQQPIINRQQWEEMNNPASLPTEDGPPADIRQRKVEGGPAAVAQETAIKTGTSGPPADEDTDELTGNPYAQGTATDQQYAAALKDILDKSKAKTTEEKRMLNPMERNRKNNPPQLYHGNTITPYRTDAMNELHGVLEKWQGLGQRWGGQ